MKKLTWFAACLMLPFALLSAGCVTGKGKENGCCAKKESGRCCVKMAEGCCSGMGASKGGKKESHAH